MDRREYKLLFVGPMGIGKTTAIASISEIPPVRTEAFNSDRSVSSKETTTTALDYGEVTLDGGDKLRLYGSPGQERFRFMWKLLAKGALGVVILIDCDSNDPSGTLRTYLDAFDMLVKEYRAVIGVRIRDHGSALAAASMRRWLTSEGLKIPLLAVDVRDRNEVLNLLDVLFNQIEYSVDINLCNQ